MVEQVRAQGGQGCTQLTERRPGASLSHLVRFDRHAGRARGYQGTVGFEMVKSNEPTAPRQSPRRAAALWCALVCAIFSAPTAYAGDCEGLVKAIAANTKAEIEKPGPDPFWVSLKTPGTTRIEITCYGEVSEALAEVVLEGAAPSEAYFTAVARVASALGSEARNIEAASRSCIEAASKDASGQSTREHAGTKLACLVMNEHDAAQRSTAISLSRIAPKPQLAAPRKRTTKRPAPNDACILSW